MAPERTFQPDPVQQRVLDHNGGNLLVTGGAGTGKTAVLAERFARLIEDGADPERMALVVGSKRARREAANALSERLRRSLPSLNVFTVHALAYRVMASRFAVLDYEEPPEVLSAADQFAKVRELLLVQDPARWPAYGRLLPIRGFADEVRQFVLRAQESLIEAERVAELAEQAGLGGWRELAEFYRQYLDVLGELGAVDFAGLIWQSAVAAQKGALLFDHLLVDDYQDTTLGAESLIAGLQVPDLLVAGDVESHVFSFQGTTDRPLRRFTERFPAASTLELSTDHRTDGAALEAWCASHTSEEHAAVAREVRRIHAEEGVPWGRMAIVLRRQDDEFRGLIRALDDAGVPRSVAEGGQALSPDAATHPFVLAMRWLARPDERDALVETILTSELVGLSPAAARGAIRAAVSKPGGSPAEALTAPDGAATDEERIIRAMRDALVDAEAVADRSVLDAFRILWQRLPYSHRLVATTDTDLAARQGLDAVARFAQAVVEAEDSADPSVQAFAASLEQGDGTLRFFADGGERSDAVHVLTAHAAVGREFDTVIMVGTVEGDFPSLTRPEPMFDLATLGGMVSRSERNRVRLADERRLFRMVVARAVHRVVFTASDPRGPETVLTARSRFVDELKVRWTGVGALASEPVSVKEATARWRRTLGDFRASGAERLSAVDGLLALSVDPARWWFQRDWTGSERPLHETIRVSASRLETLENCDLQFVLREELGLARPAGYHAWVGKLVHKLIEDCENGLIERTPQALLAEVERRWQPGQFPSMAVSKAFRALVVDNMLPNWFGEFAGEPALGTEKAFSFDFDGATVVGRIDRIGSILAGGNKITDFKTGKAERAGKAEENLQLGVYYLAAHEAEELAEYRPVRGVELVFLRGHWKTGEPEHRAWQVGENSAKDERYQEVMRARLSGLIEHIHELIETELYRPRTSAECFGCDFKTMCPLWPEGRELFPVGASS